MSYFMEQTNNKNESKSHNFNIYVKNKKIKTVYILIDL